MHRIEPHPNQQAKYNTFISTNPNNFLIEHDSQTNFQGNHISHNYYTHNKFHSAHLDMKFIP
jgi:hypothetical protein